MNKYSGGFIMEQILYRSLLYTLMLFLSILFLSLSYYMINTIKIKNKELNLREYDLNINSDINDDIFILLDKIIQECFSEYTILNLEYRNIEYINEELEQLITQEVAHRVIDRISPTLISKISLIYNISNFDQLLSERVYLATMAYSLQKNELKDEK